MSDPKKLKCEIHGERTWKATVMCDACGRVYQAADETKPRFAPKMCLCGVRLAPAAEGEVLDGDFSARAICDFCFKRTVKKFNGRIPNWSASA